MGIEGGNWEPETQVEGLTRLRPILDLLVKPGAGVHELERILKLVPQRDKNNKLRYLLTAGLAVELITGEVRPHHDLDLVIMDPRNVRKWEVFGTDNVTPQTYWAAMKFNPRYLDATARTVLTRVMNGIPVEVVHPAILMVQKSSNAFGRPPRQKDDDDVRALIEYWAKRESDKKSWSDVIRTSLNALPEEENQITEERLWAMIEARY